MSELDSAKPTVRRAVLVFADSLAKDLNRRAWSKRLSPLLNLPRVDSQQVDADVHLFTTGIGARIPFRGAIVHAQHGKTFGQRLSNAFDELAQRGYEQIVIVGRDCPELSAVDILDAFSALQRSRAVLGPDHRGGCYLIGLHATDHALLDGIQWQQDTDFDELLNRVGASQTLCLATKFDLDSLDDVRALSIHSRAWRAFIDSLLAPSRVHRVDKITISTDHHTRLSWQTPPPLAA